MHYPSAAYITYSSLLIPITSAASGCSVDDNYCPMHMSICPSLAIYKSTHRLTYLPTYLPNLPQSLVGHVWTASEYVHNMFIISISFDRSRRWLEYLNFDPMFRLSNVIRILAEAFPMGETRRLLEAAVLGRGSWTRGGGGGDISSCCLFRKGKKFGSCNFEFLGLAIM